MNERIKELTGKALDQAVPYTWTSLMPHELDKFAEQLAELIVQECVDIADNTATGESTYGWMVANQIKQHFGVE